MINEPSIEMEHISLHLGSSTPTRSHQLR